MLKDKVAIITGRTRGIRYATAKLFLDNSCKVIIFGSRAESVEKTIKNINTKPKYISADTIYLNQISLSYLADEKIEGSIHAKKQSKEKIGRLNKNPYHKDHFEYNYQLDAFKCPEKQYLHFYEKYTEPHKDPNKPDKIKRIYNNYEACKNYKT